MRRLYHFFLFFLIMSIYDSDAAAVPPYKQGQNFEISKNPLVYLPVYSAFTTFYPNEEYDNISFNPVCDPEKPFPQMIRLSKLENAWHIVHSCDRYKSDQVASAVLVFYFQWKHKFGDPEGKVWKELNNILIEFSPEKKVIAAAYSLDGKKILNPHIVGLALSPGWIWVYASDEPMHRTVATTSLVHELVHISLWSMKPHYEPDSDHEGPNFSGWTKKHSSLIVDTNFKLMERGL